MSNVEVIAEIANSHQGKVELALELIPLTINPGKADSIKFQIYFGEELLTKNHPRYIHFRDQAFSIEEWNKLLTEAKKLSVPIYADVFGTKALEVALSHELDGVKLHSSDLTNTQIINNLSHYSGTIFLSVGGSNLFEIDYVLKQLERYGSASRVVLMHGFQAYPTAASDSKISRIKEFNVLFGDRVELGYMDHIDAEDPLAYTLPLLALPYGARVIEKHITLDRSEKGVDYYSSLEPIEFRRFVENIRTAELALGDAPLDFSDAEKSYRDTVKKSWVSQEFFNTGQVMNDSMIIMKRTPDTASTPNYEDIVNKPVIRSLDIEQPIKRDDFEVKVLAVIVARSKSSRMPGKAFADICGESTIAHLIKRVLRAQEDGIVDTVAFCTTVDETDDRLAEVVASFPVELHRGPIENVLKRMMLAINRHNDHELVLRITGDDILIDLDYLKKAVAFHLESNADYTDVKQLPGGTEVEVFNAKTLNNIYDLATDNEGTEYLTNYITNNASQFNLCSLPVPAQHSIDCRLTIDNPEDYALVRSMIEHFKAIGKHYTYDMDDIAQFVIENTELAQSNMHLSSAGRSIDVDTRLEWKKLTQNPLVTVYITNHNYEKYIERAIESVLTQSLSQFELLIIDDGSTDNSRELIEKYRSRLGVKIIYQNNLGLNRSNNVALKHCLGKYIVRLDADDMFHPLALELMVRELEGNEEVALVYPDFFYVNESDEIIGQEVRHQVTEEVSLLDQPAHGACTLVRVSTLKALGGYSEEFNRQDGYDLWLRLTKHNEVSNINLPLFYYRQHQSNLTSDQRQLLDTRARIVRSHAEKMPANSKHHWTVIPIRREDVSQNMALQVVGENSLIDLAIKQATQGENDCTVVVTTNDENVIGYLTQQYDRKDLVIDIRPDELCEPKVLIEETISYLLDSYLGKVPEPNVICISNYEYPLRNFRYLDQMIDAINVFGADSSIGVMEKSTNLYQNLGAGMVPFVQNRSLRLERELIYEDCGGLHAFTLDYFREKRNIYGERNSAIALDYLSCFKIDSLDDIRVADSIYKILDKNMR